MKANMGIYTGLRFKGITKKQYRREISIMFNKGDWESCETPILKEFSKKSRSSWIPFGSSCDYMPDSWTENDDGFECNFDESSGWFSFACALKSYNDEVYFFVEKIVPILCSSVLHCEILYEE